jgi:RNA recognition motif-containing protein
MDRALDRSKGFGFVTYASEDEAQKALDEMNGKVNLDSSLHFVLNSKSQE